MTKRRLLAKVISGVFFLAVSLPVTCAFASEREMISAFVERGIIYYVKGEIDKAITEFSQGIQVNSKDYVAYFQRAKAYEQQDNIDAAIADYGQVIKQCPVFFLCYQAL